jgi:hypothetical protein
MRWYCWSEGCKEGQTTTGKVFVLLFEIRVGTGHRAVWAPRWRNNSPHCSANHLFFIRSGGPAIGGLEANDPSPCRQAARRCGAAAVVKGPGVPAPTLWPSVAPPLLRRERVALNRKKLYRPYREERLMVRKLGGRTRALVTTRKTGERWGRLRLSNGRNSRKVTSLRSLAAAG